MIAILVVLACAWFNRMAGGGWPSGIRAGCWDVFFGRIACSVYVGLAALAMHDWPAALAFGAGFFFWRVFSWGWLIGAVAGGHRPTARPVPSPVEGWLLERLGAHGGLFARMLFVLPCLIAVAWLAGSAWLPLLALPFAGLATLAYVAAWRWYPQHIFRVAEPLAGALWGALIVVP